MLIQRLVWNEKVGVEKYQQQSEGWRGRREQLMGWHDVTNS